MRISDWSSDVCSSDLHLGAFVVGTAGSPDKCRQAREAGCDIAIDYSLPDWPATLLAETGGRKAHVVSDSVGRHPFLHLLDRSEERRVGEEFVRPCKNRCAPYD